MNVDDYQLSTLSTNEMSEINGGIFPAFLVGVLVGLIIVDIITNGKVSD
ncbi:MAG TPA: class IIb bacteriocin, lactobin A/cerein 7B family [Bacteroidales bacterium]|nr:class IIb bacteriocin, lactobin A/cerein 7B family [Bacteroidales bacterium]